ncbi:MAG: VWA domain-containing protein [Pseudomonadota bacterium]
MRFANPEFFILLAILPVLLHWWRSNASTRAIGHGALTDLRDAIGDVATRSPRVRWYRCLPWLKMLACALAIIALARPQWGVQATRVDREGIAVAMVVDISSSMGAEDLVLDEQRRNRLAVVKHMFKKFVLGDKETLSGRDGDLVGLVTFARYSDTRSPLTLDHDALIRLVDEVTMVALSEEDGTAIGDGMVMALDNLRRVEGASRVLVVLTDGSNNAGDTTPMQAAAIAKALGIKVYTIGTGTRGMAMMPARKRGGGVELRPTMVFIDDEGLADVAEHTGGQYFRATDAEALEKIYREIDRLEKGQHVSTSYQEYVEIFAPLLIVAMILLLLDAMLRATWLRVA